MLYLLCVTYILCGACIDDSEEYIQTSQNTNYSDLKYVTYLNGYRKVEAEKIMGSEPMTEITWLDIFKTCVFLAKTNILILSYNLKALIQHSHHLNFGFYLPSDLETFVKLTKTLRKTRGFHTCL